MANEEDNVPPTNFQRLDSGVKTRGSEIKARRTEMAKKAEKEKKDRVQLKQVCNHCIV